jgi:ribosomal protein S18 acetylase RimI-like enzyme
LCIRDSGWRWHATAIRALIKDPDTVVLCARRVVAGSAARRETPRLPAPPHPAPGAGDAPQPSASAGPALGIAGFGAMHFGLERAHLMLLAVNPELQRHGIGAHLLHWLERTAMTAGIERIGLEVRARNTSARQFYRDQGYEEREYVPRYYDGVESAIRMERRLRGKSPWPPTG